MRVGLIIYGSLEILSGGYLYDRKLVEVLETQGDEVEIIGLPWRNYARHLADNFSTSFLDHLSGLNLDILLQDELNHPSLFRLNRRLRAQSSARIISIVHHLRSSEPRADWKNRVYRRIERLYLNSVDGFVFNSNTTRQVVESLLDAPRPGQVAYPAGNRLNPNITADEIAARAYEPGPLRIFFLGNVIARKALHVLVAALARLPGPEWALSIAGSLDMDERYVAAVRNQVEQTGLQNQVQFLGPLDVGSLIDMLKQQHVLVVPSFYEGFGIAYLEGMGFGLPAIASTAGAAGEIITHGQDGFLVPPGDPAALTTCLAEFYQSPGLRAEMGRAALARYHRHPTWSQSGAEIRAFLQHILESDR